MSGPAATIPRDIAAEITNIWRRCADGKISEEEAERLDTEVRTAAHLSCPKPSIAPKLTAESPQPAAPTRLRRPIEPAEDTRGRQLYIREKLAWLEQVARNPEGQKGLPLAVSLALVHLNNHDARCDPGDAVLAGELHTTERTIIRWRGALLNAGLLSFEKRTARMSRNARGHYILLIDPDEL